MLFIREMWASIGCAEQEKMMIFSYVYLILKICPMLEQEASSPWGDLHLKKPVIINM